MSTKQQLAINFIRQFAPAEFGIKKALYKLGDNELEIIFFVDKSRASRLISYLNALSSIAEGDLAKGLKISTTVFIQTDSKKISDLKKSDKLNDIELISNFKHAGACA